MVRGQSGMALYHLNNSTFQGNNFNPAFIPEGKFFLGIPGLSGVAVDFNSRIDYSTGVLKKTDGSKEFNFSKIASDAKNKNYLGLEAEISTFYMGYKPNRTTAFSFFVRERVGARLFYGGDLVDMLWNGNENYLGKSVDLSPMALDLRYYREYGVGIWKSIPNMGLNVGLRVKYLNGMFNAVTDNGFDGNIDFDEGTGKMNFAFENAIINASGLNLLDSSEFDLASHLIANKNRGFGIDIGAHWRITDELSAAFAVNDLGYIKWKVDPKNYAISDTSYFFDGIGDLTEIDNLSDAFTDSLKNVFDTSDTEKEYTTSLNSSMFGSLMYQLTPNDLVTASIASHAVRGRFRTLYALGYTRKFGRILDLSANVIRTPQQGVDLGMAMAVNLGPYQLYMASDKIIGLMDAVKIDAVDFRFGMNFIFGRKKDQIEKDDRSDLLHPSPYGKKDKIEKSDGIYWIIKKKHPRPVYEKTKFRDT